MLLLMLYVVADVAGWIVVHDVVFVVCCCFLSGAVVFVDVVVVGLIDCCSWLLDGLSCCLLGELFMWNMVALVLLKVLLYVLLSVLMLFLVALFILHFVVCRTQS
ncbi:unnamed protein product [Polarella glacialis]|uniref:Uncharacterized protein n=1 Tax=Polarella glacialis TaxID=89957 RepID=A0A813LP24_POLGL|nr:unnamed protein product [Polarella glacialis]